MAGASWHRIGRGSLPACAERPDSDATLETMRPQDLIDAILLDPDGP